MARIPLGMRRTLIQMGYYPPRYELVKKGPNYCKLQHKVTNHVVIVPIK